MPRPGRLFVPLDVNFLDDEKVLEAGERAAWLYIAMLCRCKQLGTDGYLTERQISRLHVDQWRPRLARLVEVHLVWLVEDGRYWITGWLKNNEQAAKIEERRRKDRERKQGSARIPDGIEPDSKRRVEKSREEQSTASVGCPHGTPAGPDHCALCRRESIRGVS